MQETIAAIATAPGEAGIAVLRISGPDSLAIADAVFEGRTPPSSWPANTFQHGYIASNDDPQRHLDEVILLVYRAPASYTREDVVEIQGHGGRTSAARILRAVLAAGARPAEPGEFTRRAFLNGRLDLLQAEAVLDLIRARTDRAALAAMEQLDGVITHFLQNVYDDISESAADLEVTLDFEEDTLPPPVFQDIAQRLSDATGKLEALLAGWGERHLLREGARVVIAGKPNVGKSTLLNAMLGTDRSIVTPVPGTTRDTVEEEMALAGIPLRLVDTAGLRQEACEVEREGIRRTRQSLSTADLALYVLDASVHPDPEVLAEIRELPPGHTILILNKTDLGNAASGSVPSGYKAVRTCLIRGDGLRDVQDAILAALKRHPTPPHAMTSERHYRTLARAVASLRRAGKILEDGGDAETASAAFELREALEAIGSILGKVYDEELLNHIFSRFCIGK